MEKSVFLVKGMPEDWVIRHGTAIKSEARRIDSLFII
jgi:hypothetical protein